MMNLGKCRSAAIARCAVALWLAWFPARLEAKAWLNGHIIELRPDGFILQTRFYPHITVHIAADTIIRCKKRILKAGELQVQDLVTVEGRDKRDAGLEATKITIHRDWPKCREMKGPKPAHCAS
jgi:hypothetical protein